MSDERRLEEIIRYAETIPGINLTEKEKQRIRSEYYYGAENYKGECLPGIAGAIDYIQKKEDAGRIQAAKYIRELKKRIQ